METPTPTLLIQALADLDPGISLAGTTTYTERLQTCGCSTRGTLHSLNALYAERNAAVRSTCAQAHNPLIQGQHNGVQVHCAEPVSISGVQLG